MTTKSTPVRALVLRIEQLDSPNPGTIVVEATGEPVAYRLNGMPVCAPHSRELGPYVSPDSELRRVLSWEDIESLVVEFGLNRNDIRRLHGPRDGESCTLCPTTYVEGNICISCERPLHPKWPAVYCSNECAWADV